MLTRTNLQLGGYMYVSYRPKSLQWEDSQCDHAYVAKPHPDPERGFAQNRERDQDHGFGSLKCITAV